MIVSSVRNRTTAAPLIWAGARSGLCASHASYVQAGDQVVAWKSRTNPANLIDLERRGATLVEAEDGFIRSIGLGADCVPPLSLVVDHLGYFDPGQPSELENMLQYDDFRIEFRERARRLRRMIVELGSVPRPRRTSQRVGRDYSSQLRFGASGCVTGQL